MVWGPVLDLFPVCLHLKTGPVLRHGGSGLLQFGNPLGTGGAWHAHLSQDVPRALCFELTCAEHVDSVV